MSDAPWLTIIGLGEDGPDGLTTASHDALAQADFVMGPPRHLALLSGVTCKQVEWPVPFADGLDVLDGMRGQKVVVLASGDPFWFGAGSVIARRYDAGEWRALPGTSAFSLAAARLGWTIERTATVGLHAAPMTRLRPLLANGKRMIVLLRDGAAVATLCEYLVETGFGQSQVHVMEALGGPNERVRHGTADTPGFDDAVHPVCVGIETRGDGDPLALVPGRADRYFDNDGQITKSPMRALTLAALAPKPGEYLWDIGGGSGSVAIEWLLSGPDLSATCIETQLERAERIRRNAERLGVDHLGIVTGTAPEAIDDLKTPDVVFIGGGLSEELLQYLNAHLPAGTRLVANAVTLESEAVLAGAQEQMGGDLLRIDLAHVGAIGRKRGWKSAYPVVQWSVTL